MPFFKTSKELRKKWNSEAFQEMIDLSSRHEIPKDVKNLPDDLYDGRGLFISTRRGYAVAGRVTIQDIAEGNEGPGAYVATFYEAMMLSASFFFLAVVGPTFLKAALTILFIAYIGLRYIVASRENGLLFFLVYAFMAMSVGGVSILGGGGGGQGDPLGQLAQSGAEGLGVVLALFYSLFFVLIPGFEWLIRHSNRMDLLKNQCQGYGLLRQTAGHEARRKQADNAAKDKTPFLRLGRATGFVHQQTTDPLAPDEGKPMGLTIKDLSTHLLTLGATGTGKTSGVFRPLAHQIGQTKGLGILVMDGKGQLPEELWGSLDGYELLTPETATIGLIEGLTPEDLVEAIVATMSGEFESKEPIWKESAARLLWASAHVVKSISELKHDPNLWNLQNVSEIGNNKTRLETCLALLEEQDAIHPLDPVTEEARTYFKSEFKSFSLSFRGSILGHLNGWLAPLLSNSKLKPWCRAHEGVDITQVLKGKRMGLALPAYRYGVAGPAVAALLKLRLYRAAQLRGDGWEDQAGQTAVILLMDEAQEILTDTDIHMAPVARSLGISIVAGTQSVEQIYHRYGQWGGDSLLAQFRSILAFDCSPTSQQWIQNRCGALTNMRHSGEYKALHFKATLDGHVTNPAHDPDHPDSFAFSFPDHKSLTGEIVTRASLAAKGLVNLYHDPTDHYYVNSEETLLPLSWIQEQLTVPFRALAVFNRGGVPRRDFLEVETHFNE